MSLDIEHAIASLRPLAELPRNYRESLRKKSSTSFYAEGSELPSTVNNGTHIVFLLAGKLRQQNPKGKPIVHDATAHPLAAPIFEPGQTQAPLSALQDSHLLLIPYSIYKRQVELALSAPPASAAELVDMDDWGSMDGLERALSYGVFAQMNAINIQRALLKIEELPLETGDTVVNQGDPGDFYYVLKSGSVEIARTDSNGREYRLGVKGPGTAFGEEALVTGSNRNATVRMLTSGSVMRIAKNDFIELIRDPLLRHASREYAERLVEKGAYWLDVRDEASFVSGSMLGALNVPVALLRLKREGLNREDTYIVCSDDLNTSALGCYLLVERGFDAYLYEGELQSTHNTTTFAPTKLQTAALPPTTTLPTNASPEAPPTTVNADNAVDPPPAPEPAALPLEEDAVAAAVRTERNRCEAAFKAQLEEIKADAQAQVTEKIAALEAQYRSEMQQKIRQLRSHYVELQAYGKALAAQKKTLDELRNSLGEQHADAVEIPAPGDIPTLPGIADEHTMPLAEGDKR